MPQKIGRNDSCPCGSGRKYKKCCLASLDREMESLQRFVDLGRTGSPDELLRTATAVIENARELRSDRAIVIVATLVSPLRRAGRTAELDRFIRDLRSRHPRAYDGDPSWFDLWLAGNAILLPDGDLETPLSTFAARLPEDLDLFLRLADMLLYHDRVAILPQAMLRALPSIHADDTADEDDVWEFEEVLFALLLHEHVEADPDLRPNDAIFLGRTEPVRRMGADWLAKIVAQACGRGVEKWRAVEFQMASDDALGDLFFLLAADFALALHREWGWSRSRAELARDGVNYWLSWMDECSSRSGRGARLAKAIVFAEVEGALDTVRPYLEPGGGARPHRAAAFVAALPYWLRFAARHGLIPQASVRRLQDKLAARFSDLPEILEQTANPDPVLLAEASRPWDDAPPAPPRPRRPSDSQMGLFGDHR